MSDIGEQILTFIAIGGPSGVGKTSVVEDLLRKKDRYVRPAAYTTRQERVNDATSQFKYVTEQEIKSLHENDLLLTLDKVQNYYYGLSKPDVQKIINSGLFPIKEFYIDHHLTLKMVVPHLLSVLLMPACLDKYTKHIRNSEELSFRTKRDPEAEYNNHFLHLNTASTDIVIFNDFCESIESISNRVDECISSFLAVR